MYTYMYINIYTYFYNCKTFGLKRIKYDDFRLQFYVIPLFCFNNWPTICKISFEVKVLKLQKVPESKISILWMCYLPCWESFDYFMESLHQ